MSEMTNRVARAIELELNVMMEPGTTTTIWTLADKAARAAIAELRIPTEAMVNAKIDTSALTKNHDGTTVTGYHPPIRQPDHIDWWQAMVDAALKE